MIPLILFVILGAVQGILEWLPVSSEGQILFLGNLFGISDQSLLLSVAFWLHFGTMFSVFILFKDEWLQIINLKDPNGEFLREFLVITTIGTAITGIPIKLFLLEAVSGEEFGFWIMIILGIALIGTGILLKLQKSHLAGDRRLEDLTYIESLIIGLFQGLTIIPGVSRSGTTVTVLLFQDIDSDHSFRGSFFMSVPAVLGAISLDLIDYLRGESTSIVTIQPLGILVAIIVSCILGIVTMRALIKIAQDIDFSNIVILLALFVFLYILLLLGV